MKTKSLDPEQTGLKEDWLGGDAAFECPVCSQVYLVNSSISPVRTCPVCGKSEGHVRGTRRGGGKAFVVWERFEPGQTFARAKISQMLGGKDKDCLPYSHGLVVCGCFNPTRHPEAPAVILVGTGYIVQHGAKIMCAQKQPFPVFIQREYKKWEFVGYFLAERSTTDPQELAAHHQGSIIPLPELTQVIFLKPA